MSSPMNEATLAAEGAETPVNENPNTATEAPPAEEPATGLPSDNTEGANPWDTKELMGEDGMIGGKYKSLEALLKSAQEGDKHIADLNAAKQSTDAKAANAEKSAEADAKRSETANELVRNVLEGGMEITAETLAAAKEAGISPESIELAALKGKAHIDKMTSIVGGPETYNKMMADMGANMSEAEKAQFTSDVQGSMSEYAVRGIHQAWMEKTGQRHTPKRVEGGQPQAAGVKPYATQQELRADLNYLQTKGRTDKAAWAAHNARKSITPDSVFYSR